MNNSKEGKLHKLNAVQTQKTDNYLFNVMPSHPGVEKDGSIFLKVYKYLTNLGIEDGMDETLNQQVKLVNSINSVLALLIITIGGMFCMYSQRLTIIIPAGIELSCVLISLYYNSKKRYNLAAWLTYITQFTAVLYFSLLLRDVLDLNVMVVWLLSIVFIIFRKRKQRVIAVAAALVTMTLMTLSLYFPPILEAVQVSKSLAILFKHSAFFGVVVLILSVGNDYVRSRDANPKLNAQSREKSMLVKTLSHELRNPFHQQYALIQLVVRSLKIRQPEEALKLAQLMIDSSKQTISFLDNVIELSRIDANEKRTAEHTLFSLQVMIKRYTKICTPLARQHQLEVRFEMEGFPEAVYSDPQRLWHILNNLVCNAINYAYKGTVITVKLWTSDTYFYIEVVNESATIPANVLNNIFAPFWTSGRNGGGLGLFLVKDAVELMQGTVRMESADDLVRVKIKLPLEIGFVEDIPNDQSTEQAGVLDLTNLRVYLADDDKFNQLALQRSLETFGCSVAVFGHGQQLIEAMKISMPDLIFLDGQMPVLNGFETIAYLKSKAAYKHIPVIFAHGDAAGEDLLKVRKLAAATVVKPFGAEELETVLLQVVRQSKIAGMRC